MKKIFSLLCLLVCLSCKKGEVPGNMSHYVGTWNGDTEPTEVIKLVINADGTASYEERTMFTSKSISGYIYFDAYDFKIGTKRINKKFKAHVSPRRVPLSVNPYTYKYIATFNGVDYIKE